MAGMLKRLPALLLALFLSACTSVPFDYPRTDSRAIPAEKTTLYGAAQARWIAEHGTDDSGFVPLIPGLDALGARLVMMEEAEVSIDAKYFLIKPDQAGELFLGKLLRAADRGVRVRLLVDDIFTSGMDRILTLFDSHPNIEVRLFNPVSRASPKFWSYLWDFQRVNRRMHNKAFVVDGSLAIVGGRNIAEEYFELEPQQDFDDLEVLLIGGATPYISSSFDMFWNSDLSVPIAAFGIDISRYRLEKWLQLMDDIISGERSSAYASAINSPVLTRIREGEKPPVPGRSRYYWDRPEKLEASRDDQEHRVMEQALEKRILRAEREVILITPYLIPSELGLSYIEEAIERGVRVVLITNSLASTNHVAVHSAYAPHRAGLLKAGAEIYEVRVTESPSATRKNLDPERTTLHTKAVIIDREQLFVGSLNFDPRSIELNTEVGLFIESPELTASYLSLIERDLPRFTYRVMLSEQGKLEWHYLQPGEETVLHKEPDTSFGRRFSAGLWGLLPIDDQL